MSEVSAPRHLVGLVSTQGKLRSRYLCQTPSNVVRLTLFAFGCQAEIALHILTHIHFILAHLRMTLGSMQSRAGGQWCVDRKDCTVQVCWRDLSAR